MEVTYNNGRIGVYSFYKVKNGEFYRKWYWSKDTLEVNKLEKC